jgi:rhodanese-related sulfurtransferase
MSSTTTISVEKLGRLIGRPDCPHLIDVRTDEDIAADPRLIPGAVRRAQDSLPYWTPQLRGGKAVVVCQKGLKLSEGVAAWLRYEGVQAEVLEGGSLAWAAAGLPSVPIAKLPRPDTSGRTVWVTRSRPKIDRIACPWLIRRFVDRNAVFLFVSPSEVPGVAERFGATPFDIEGESVFWTHRGEACTFDVMVTEFGLSSAPLDRLATIVRGADTARPDLAPECAGLLAASLGLSRMYADDLAQLQAGLGLYDAFFRWCRDATAETHNWPARSGKPSDTRRTGQVAA